MEARKEQRYMRGFLKEIDIWVQNFVNEHNRKSIFINMRKKLLRKIFDEVKKENNEDEEEMKHIIQTTTNN